MWKGGITWFCKISKAGDCKAILSYRFTQKHLPILANNAIAQRRGGWWIPRLWEFSKMQERANKRSQQVTLHNFTPSALKKIMLSCFGITHNTGTFSHLDTKIIILWWKSISHLATCLIVWAIINSLSTLKSMRSSINKPRYKDLNKETCKDVNLRSWNVHTNTSALTKYSSPTNVGLNPYLTHGPQQRTKYRWINLASHCKTTSLFLFLYVVSVFARLTENSFEF